MSDPCADGSSGYAGRVAQAAVAQPSLFDRPGIVRALGSDRMLSGDPGALTREAWLDDSSSTWKGRPGTCGHRP